MGYNLPGFVGHIWRSSVRSQLYLPQPSRIFLLPLGARRVKGVVSYVTHGTRPGRAFFGKVHVALTGCRPGPMTAPCGPPCQKKRPPDAAPSMTPPPRRLCPSFV